MTSPSDGLARYVATLTARGITLVRSEKGAVARPADLLTPADKFMLRRNKRAVLALIDAGVNDAQAVASACLAPAVCPFLGECERAPDCRITEPSEQPSRQATA